ncbi:MAG: exonuclease [Euryarchaeota archaeon]|nr:exonuclease [Euryarchaeota archaeon]
MLRRSFVLLRGVGRRTERHLRSLGVVDWKGFLAAPQIAGIGKARKAALDAHLRALDRCLERGNAATLAQALPPSEKWRLYPDFRDRAAFLDIETTGLDLPATVTVVGITVGRDHTPLVRGVNLSKAAIERALRPARIIVTFNGSSFDLPALRMAFPGLELDLPHIDLRHLAPRAGIRGGLKKVERILGIRRAREVRMLCSHDAVYLWRIWERKRSGNALRLLIDYNRADVENLRAVADAVVDIMARKNGYQEVISDEGKC